MALLLCCTEGERISHVSRVLKRLVLDLTELHDVQQQLQHSRNQVPAQHSTTVNHQPRSFNRQRS